MNEIITTFLIAMAPVVELRGAIPAGVISGLDIHVAFIVAVLGNLVPVPFVLLFIRKAFTWLRGKSERLGNIVAKLERKAEKKKAQVLRAEFWGLVFLVAVPLPGTGAWTGALVAAILDLRMKSAIPAITLGILIAGVIVTIMTYGVSAIV